MLISVSMPMHGQLHYIVVLRPISKSLLAWVVSIYFILKSITDTKEEVSVNDTVICKWIIQICGNQELLHCLLSDIGLIIRLAYVVRGLRCASNQTGGYWPPGGRQ